MIPDSLKWEWRHVLKGYKSPYDEDGAEDVILEGEQSQAHVGEDEVLSEEVKDFKELQETFYICITVSV